MTERITMRDIAAQLGVSPMTVSRALRGDGMVSRETRQKVQELADASGYVYDSTAQAFRTQKSGFVAVTLPSINNANFADTYQGLSDGLQARNLQVLLGSTNYGVAEEERIIRQLLARNPQAIVLTGGHHSDATRSLLNARSIPVVEIWDLPQRPLGHAVGFSNRACMRPIVEHLAETGRSKLAYLGAEPGTDTRGAERREGVLKAARELDLPEVVCLSAGFAPVSMRQGAEAVRALGDAVAEFDALVCVSDPVAFGAYSECSRMDISVPEQLAITGFGNFEIAAVSEPTLTTVGVSAHEIGARTADILAAHFSGDGKAEPAIFDVGARLIRGGTS